MSHLPESIARGSDLATVADAINRATPVNGPVYVERRGTLYRWSLTHRGGPYPLLRETAKLLGIDYHALVLPCRALEGTGLSIVAQEPPSGPPDAWALVDFRQATDAESVAQRIRTQLTDAQWRHD